MSWYFLSDAGALIRAKKKPDLADGPFIKKIWHVTSDNTTRCGMLVEGAALGASEDSLKRLIKKWAFTDTTFDTYAMTQGIIITGNYGDGWTATPVQRDLFNDNVGRGRTRFLALVDMTKRARLAKIAAIVAAH